jgi:DNA-binding Lrp family transcriptional regulator
MTETFLLINCDTGKEQQVVTHLQSLECVKEVQATNGVYDIIAKLELETERELNDTISLKILKIDQVRSVMMLQSV